MRRIHTALVLTVVAASFTYVAMAEGTEHVVAPDAQNANDDGPGSAAAPLRTLAKALAVAKGGDVILLADGKYPAVSIGKKYDPPIAIRGAKDARPEFVGGLTLTAAAGVRVEGVKFTWTKDARPTKAMTPFIAIVESRDIEVAACEIVDDPARAEWVGWACQISRSEKIIVRDSRFHHFYFGVSLGEAKDVTLRNLDIGPWTHEDGIRVTRCEGPVLVDGCHLTNTGVPGQKGGHVDAIQSVYWSDNITIRNCHIHGVTQAIGAFGVRDPRGPQPPRRRKNWRVEGNLIYDVYTPHYCTIVEADGVVVINNTIPHGSAILSKCTDAVVRNNIFGTAGRARGLEAKADYNIWMAGGTKVGEQDLVGVDPRFVSAEVAFFKLTHNHVKDCTTTRLYPHEMRGRLVQGDEVEIALTDGSARDGRLYKVTAVGDNWIDIDPPLPSKPGFGGVLIYKWPAGTKNPTPDYHLRPDSPAVDSADGDVERAADMDGHAAADMPDVENAGGGKVPYLDRGALEYTPRKE